MVELGVDNKEAMVEGKIVRSRDNAEMQGDEAGVESLSEGEAANGRPGVDTESNHKNHLNEIGIRKAIGAQIIAELINGVNDLTRRNFLGAFKSAVSPFMKGARLKKRPLERNIVMATEANEAINDAIRSIEFEPSGSDTADKDNGARGSGSEPRKSAGQPDKEIGIGEEVDSFGEW